jgi:hypothetical protein
VTTSLEEKHAKSTSGIRHCQQDSRGVVIREPCPDVNSEISAPKASLAVTDLTDN